MIMPLYASYKTRCQKSIKIKAIICLHLIFLFVQIENEQSRMEVIRANREQMDRKKANKEAEKKEVEDMLFYQGRV